MPEHRTTYEHEYVHASRECVTVMGVWMIWVDDAPRRAFMQQFSYPTLKESDNATVLRA